MLEAFDHLVMHAADYAEVVGVRRTRAGRWVVGGRTYRTRALALRRVPKQVVVRGTGLRVSMVDGVPRGTVYGIRPPWSFFGGGW